MPVASALSLLSVTAMASNSNNDTKTSVAWSAAVACHLCLCNGAVEHRRTVTQAAESVKMETTAGGTAAIRFYLLSSRQFSAHTKSSHARIDKRTAQATRNTRYRYNQIGPLDNCVSLARTNTSSSTITKIIKTWKKSNKSYSYNLLNRINVAGWYLNVDFLATGGFVHTIMTQTLNTNTDGL